MLAGTYWVWAQRSSLMMPFLAHVYIGIIVIDDILSKQLFSMLACIRITCVLIDTDIRAHYYTSQKAGSPRILLRPGHPSPPPYMVSWPSCRADLKSLS